MFYVTFIKIVYELFGIFSNLKYMYDMMILEEVPSLVHLAANNKLNKTKFFCKRNKFEIVREA